MMLLPCYKKHAIYENYEARDTPEDLCQVSSCLKNAEPSKERKDRFFSVAQCINL